MSSRRIRIASTAPPSTKSVISRLIVSRSSAFEPIEKRPIDGRRFELQDSGIRKGAGKIDQNDVPDRVEQDIALVRVDIADQVLKHLLPAQLEVVGLEIGGGGPELLFLNLLQHLHVLSPQLQGDVLTVVGSRDRRRHHVELEHAIELVRRDLGLVAFEEAVVFTRRNSSQQPRSRPARPA